MNRTKIEYLNYTWNPIVGCTGIGCSVRSVCWARKITKRFKNRCLSCYTFTPHLHRERLNQPFKAKKPSRIGVNFNGDTFDVEVHPDWQDDVLEVIEKCKWHTFLVLTKQPQNIPKWFDYETPNNLWLGVTVNCVKDLWRIDTLKRLLATVKFVSFEPLLEDFGSKIDLAGINWVIIGAQTRPKLMPMYTWVTNIIDATQRYKIPIFLKNNLYVSPDAVKRQQYPS